MGRSLYVGNLPYSVTDNELCDLFVNEGLPVASTRVVRDRETGLSKGFGFVDLVEESDFEVALQKMDRKDIGGRSLRVSEAVQKDRPRAPRVDDRGGARGFDRPEPNGNRARY